MLLSTLFGECAELVAAAAGQVRIQAPEQSDAVSRIQQALLAIGFELPSGPDGVFGAETASAVVAFKTSRGLFPNDPVLGVGTSTRLDREIAFMEGAPLQQAAPEGGLIDPTFDEDSVLAHEPFVAARLDQMRPDRGIPDKILRFFELSDEFCLPLSALWGPQVASTLGKLVDPKIMSDYCQLQTCAGDDFFDLSNNSTLYALFLEVHNPGVPSSTIKSVGGSVRPDILRHRTDAQEWYETKPLTPSGVTEWLTKAARLRWNYAGTFPYVAGTRYKPSPEILLGSFDFIEGGGGHLEVFIEPRRPASGMILYRICLRGDFVRYFNAVRLTAGILAIVAALAPEILAAGVEAGDVAAFTAAIEALAAEFQVVLPVLTRSM